MRLIDMLNKQKAAEAAKNVVEPAPAVESKPKTLGLLGKPKASTPVTVPANAEPAPTEAPVPVVQKQQGVELDIAPGHEDLKMKEDMTIQDHINALQHYAESNLGISALTMDKCQHHMMEMMKILRTQPELDSCLLDRDVANVLQVVRRLREDATYVIEKTKINKEKKAAKSKGGNVNFDDIEMPDFNQLAPPKSIQALAKLK